MKPASAAACVEALEARTFFAGTPTGAGPDSGLGPAGAFDTTFGTNGIATLTLQDLNNLNFQSADSVLQPDGKIVIAGFVYGTSGLGSEDDLLVIRVAPDGSFDETFGGTGKVFLDFGHLDEATSVVLQGDGKIVVAGQTSFQAEGFDFFDTNVALARLNSDGTPDETFGGDGLVTTDFADDPAVRPTIDFTSGVVIAPDEKILVVGSESGGGDFQLARYNPDGSLDNSFGQGGKRTVTVPTLDFASAVTIQPNGQIVAVGASLPSRESDERQFAITRFSPDGDLDPSFGVGGRVTTGFLDFDPGGAEPEAVAVQPDGKVVVGGRTIGFDTLAFTEAAADFVLARYNPDGSLDGSFGFDGRIRTDFGASEAITDIGIQSDGRIVAGGRAAADLLDNPQGTGVAVARYLPSGDLDAGFSGDGRLTFSPNVTPAASGEAGPSHLSTLQAADDPLARLIAENTGLIEITPRGRILVVAASGQLIQIAAIVGDDGAPAISVTVSDVVQGGNPSSSVVVRYTDDFSVLASSIDLNDAALRAVGPNGFDQPLTFVSFVNEADDGPEITAVYRLPAAGGEWDRSDNGDYTIQVQAGQISDSFGRFTQPGPLLSGGRNSTFRVVIAPPVAPDFVATASGVQAGTFIGGTDAKATIRVTNQGNAASDSAVAVAVYLSADELIDSGDKLLATQSRRLKVREGATGVSKVRFRYPTDVPDGQYFVLARCDSGDDVLELDEMNNDASSGLKVTLAAPFVDLRAVLVNLPNRPGGLAQGKAAPISLRFDNVGNIRAKGQVRVSFFLSPDQKLDLSSDRLLGEDSFTLNVRPFATRTRAMKPVFPAGLASGIYFVIGVIDAANLIVERDELNNAAVAATMFVVP